MGRKDTPFPQLQFMAQSVPPPQIVMERHMTIVRGPNLIVAFPHL